ncbi:MAG: peptide chain release factor N(5)-glutamine methyltransferase [Bacteroidota bacterium]
MNTINDFITLARQELLPLYDAGELNQILFLLVEDVMGFSKTDFQLKKNEPLSGSDSEKLGHFIEQLKLNKPVQYVLGSTWFSGMKFIVNENVLIPRPETEELCSWLLSHISQLQSHISLLDIGTGSGCIAITLKKNLPSASVHAMDISPGALEVAKQNAELNKTEIIFYQGDILSKDFETSGNEKFDVIVSNPPYIRRSEMNSMSVHVKDHEPHTALFVKDDDALLFYRAIVDFSKNHLKENGRLFFEINASMGQEIQDLLLEKGFRDIELKKDLSGNSRMVQALAALNHLIT